MIGLGDRQALARDIDVAHTAGARLKPACETAGIDLRTLQRWKAFDGVIRDDRRPQAIRPAPSHALSEAERAHLLAVANAPRFVAAEALFRAVAVGVVGVPDLFDDGPIALPERDGEQPAGGVVVEGLLGGAAGGVGQGASDRAAQGAPSCGG